MSAPLPGRRRVARGDRRTFPSAVHHDTRSCKGLRRGETPAHQVVLSRLNDAVRRWAEAQARPPLVLFAPLDVRLSETTVVQPDLCLWLAGLDLRRPAPTPPPDVAAEVLSPSTRRRDVVRKRRLYAHAGVPELWLVDPDDRAVVALRGPAGDDHADVVAVREDDELTSPLLLGLAVPVAPLFP